VVYDVEMSRDDPQMKIRLPEALKTQIEESAAEAGRSLNAEIVERLTRSYQADDSFPESTAILRTMATYLAMRHDHPEVMAPMETSMLELARSIRRTPEDEKLFDATAPSIAEYVGHLVAAVDRVTALLGPGWAKKKEPTTKSS